MNEHTLPYELLSIKNWKDAFILNRRKRNLASNTINYYQRQLDDFEIFAEACNVILVPNITTDLLNTYVLHLETNGHNAGGIHAMFRALRAFLKWYGRNAEPNDWQNPIKTVNLPKKKSTPISLSIFADIEAMIATCKDDFTGTRDKAVMLCLLDTTVGAAEFLNINLQDIDLTSGNVIIRKRKGKPRTVRISQISRRALHNYLRFRADENQPALWLTTSGERLTTQRLYNILVWRGKMAGVEPPNINDFKHASRLDMYK